MSTGGGAGLAKSGKERDPAQDNQDALIVDQLLRKLRPVDQARPAAPRRMAVASVTRPAQTRRAGVWARVGLGVLVGIALTQWPYQRGCGWWLLFYLSAVATVVVTGVWSASFSWRSRLGLAHVAALGTIFWGFVLTADEVLPRVGYARTPATWRCAERRAAVPIGKSLLVLQPRHEAPIAVAHLLP